MVYSNVNEISLLFERSVKPNPATMCGNQLYRTQLMYAQLNESIKCE